MIKVIPDNFDIDTYNSVAHHPLQSWQWGEARKVMGIDVLRLAEFEGDILKDVYQLTFHKIPYTNFKIGYLPRSVTPSVDLQNYLFEYGKNHGLIFIKIEPNSNNFNPGADLKIVKSQHPLFPEWSILLDLTKTEEELMANMKPKTRYNIRLAQKKGVVVREESNENGFKIFSGLYFDTCKRQKYFGHTPQYHRIVWDALKNNIAHILIAYSEDLPLASYELFLFNNRFYYPYGGTAIKDRHLMAANLIMWESISLGKRLGATEFDMWGSLPPNYVESHPWSGFTKFKEGYGGKFIQFAGSFDLIVNPVIYSFYNRIYSVRQKLLGLFY